ncbi:MAG: CarD family transcriptional regulator [Armatimonadota bacterium]
MDIGDLVLHPRYGVGVIDGIETRVQDGQERSYYVIPKPTLSSTLFVPVDSADEVGLRPVASPDTLKKALAILTGEDDEKIKSVGSRELVWNDPLSLARAIRRHITGPKSRYPKVSEQHLMKRARKLLEEELAVVLGLDEETITAIMNGERIPDTLRAGQSA